MGSVTAVWGPGFGLRFVWDRRIDSVIRALGVGSDFVIVILDIASMDSFAIVILGIASMTTLAIVILEIASMILGLGVVEQTLSPPPKPPFSKP